MRLARPGRVYADTSVYGGPFDEEFRGASEAFFAEVRADRWNLVISALVRDEIALSPPKVRELFSEFEASAEIVEIAAAALALRNGYVDAGIVRKESMADALHVALSSIAACDVIVSWNFRDIVNYRRIPLYNAVNTLQGYGQIAIHTPREVLADEDQDETV